MDRRFFAAVIFASGVLAVSGCSTTSSVASMFSGDSLISGLTSNLGLSATQAAGGLGSVMSLAESKLAGADYASIAQLLPNASKYLDVARQAGISTDAISSVADLNSAMSKLGVSPSQASQLVSSVGDFVGTAGGDSAKNMIMGLMN